MHLYSYKQFEGVNFNIYLAWPGLDHSFTKQASMLFRIISLGQNYKAMSGHKIEYAIIRSGHEIEYAINKCGNCLKKVDESYYFYCLLNITSMCYIT